MATVLGKRGLYKEDLRNRSSCPILRQTIADLWLKGLCGGYTNEADSNHGSTLQPMEVTKLAPEEN